MLWKEHKLCLQQQACVWSISDAASELQQKYSSIFDFAAAPTQVFLYLLWFFLNYFLLSQTSQFDISLQMNSAMF